MHTADRVIGQNHDTDNEKVTEIQLAMNFRRLPEVILSLCQEPKGIFDKLLSNRDCAISKQLLQDIDDGLNWYGMPNKDDAWLVKTLLECCGINTKKNESQQLALLAEINAYCQLCFCYRKEAVSQLKENGGKKGKTPDFLIGKDLYVEVYCPDQALEHKELVSTLTQHSDSSNPVSIKTTLSRPVTGNKTKAKKYSANKTIARLLQAKRDNDQTRAGSKNILWLNLTNKLNLCVLATLPMRSVSKQHENNIGSFGLWHSFYGVNGSSLFGCEDHSLRFHDNFDTYKQKDYNGIFRDIANLSAAVIQCRDGVVIYQNPWANIPLTDQQLIGLFKINKFRPEYSWITFSGLGKLASKIEDELELVSEIYKATSSDSHTDDLKS